MAIQWFYLTGGGQAAGPVDTEELRRLAEAGIVRPDTLVRQATSGLWVRAEQVRGLPPASPAQKLRNAWRVGWIAIVLAVFAGLKSAFQRHEPCPELDRPVALHQFLERLPRELESYHDAAEGDDVRREVGADASHGGDGVHDEVHTPRHSFAIRNVTLAATPPQGFVLLQDDSIRSRLVHPPDTTLHLVFVSELDAARIGNGETPALDKYISILSSRKLDQNVITPAMFDEIKSHLKDGADWAEEISRNLRIMNEFLGDKGLRVNEARVIGFTESRDSYTVTGLVKHQGQRVRANALTMRNLGGCCVMVVASAVYRDQQDVAWSTSIATECAASLMTQ